MRQLDPKRLARISEAFRRLALTLDETRDAWREHALAARQLAAAKKRNDQRLRYQKEKGWIPSDRPEHWTP